MMIFVYLFLFDGSGLSSHSGIPSFISLKKLKQSVCIFFRSIISPLCSLWYLTDLMDVCVSIHSRAARFVVLCLWGWKSRWWRQFPIMLRGSGSQEPVACWVQNVLNISDTEDVRQRRQNSEVLFIFKKKKCFREMFRFFWHHIENVTDSMMLGVWKISILKPTCAPHLSSAVFQFRKLLMIFKLFISLKKQNDRRCSKFSYRKKIMKM